MLCTGFLTAGASEGSPVTEAMAKAKSTLEKYPSHRQTEKNASRDAEHISPKIGHVSRSTKDKLDGFDDPAL